MKCIVGIILAILHLTSSTKELSNIDDLRRYVVQTLSALAEEIHETNDINNAGSAITDDQLLHEIRKIGNNISVAENTIDGTGFSHLSMLLLYAQFESEVTNMNDFYDSFRRFQRDPVRINQKKSYETFARYILDNTDKGVNSTINKLHYYTLPQAGPSLFKQSIQESNSNICEMQQSQQQVIYNLYNMVTIAELKGFTMLNFAWMLLKLYEKGNFTTEAELLKNTYTQRTEQKAIAAKEAMAEADRSLYRCDAKKWVEGESYIRLTKLLQGYIENEVNLNKDRTCRENCNFYQSTRYEGCFKQQFCSKQESCKGEVTQCKYIDSDMDICKSSNVERRYDWVEYENGSTLGSKGSCNARKFKVDSWWRYLFWHCSYCFCLCDDSQSTKTDRYFNLRQVVSDEKQNKVITGVRLVKENQVIHIQIQQGLLQERGVINKTSQQWLPVNSYSIYDHEVLKGKDYHMMTFQERAIDLDDAVAPDGNVLTGVRFRKIGSHLNLEIRSTPFDFETGQLKVEWSNWIGNDNTDGNLESPRKEVRLINPDIPTRQGPTRPDSKHDQYLKFGESSMVFDASQSTIPYLDSQPLDSKGVPLSGIGIHHRGSLNSGGFVALKIITYDFAPHITIQSNNLA